MFPRLTSSNLFMNLDNLMLYIIHVIFLKHKISQGEIRTNLEKMTVLMALKIPTTFKQLEQMIGIVNNCCCCKVNFTTISVSLYSYLQGNHSNPNQKLESGPKTQLSLKDFISQFKKGYFYHFCMPATI
jgi:hypothetical protein